MEDTKWTNEQLQAIETRRCNLLVAAAAGSGKTAVLVERIIRIITNEENHLPRAVLRDRRVGFCIMRTDSDEKFFAEDHGFLIRSGCLRFVADEPPRRFA